MPKIKFIKPRVSVKSKISLTSVRILDENNNINNSLTPKPP